MTMDNKEEIKATARRWLLRLSLESPTEHERAQFAAWRAQDPRHAAAYERFESIWQDAATLTELAPLARMPSCRGTWWQRLHASLVIHPLRWAGSAGVAVAITAVGFWFLLAPTRYATYSTGIAEVRAIHLSDGSEVTLGARSSLTVAFRHHERRVNLMSGVAFFSVVKNPSCPFIVRVGDEEVRDVGTQFEVRREPAGIRVSVIEGAVEVMRVPERAREAGGEAARTTLRAAQAPRAMVRNRVAIVPIVLTANGSAEAHVLTAGRQITVGLDGAIPDPQVMPSVQPAAWRYGRLVYVNAPLKDIIADANRYSREPIEIADERVANMRVSVTYPSDQVEQMVSALAHGLSLEVERRKGGGTVLKAGTPGD